MNTAPALIFVIEDELSIARLVQSVLVEFGFEVECFHTGASALRRLAVRRPDLCITDLGLPDMDGIDLVRQISQQCPCGLLILSGRGHTADRIMGLELGGDDYVTKPFEPRELVARVRSILRRYQPEPAADAEPPGIAHFVGWRFERATHRLISPEGEEDTLSLAESQLLIAFLERPNQILSREQLLGERDVDPFDRSIDVRISRLRRKLDDDPQNPKLIKTVYGAGYLFSAQVEWQ